MKRTNWSLLSYVPYKSHKIYKKEMQAEFIQEVPDKAHYPV